MLSFVLSLSAASFLFSTQFSVHYRLLFLCFFSISSYLIFPSSSLSIFPSAIRLPDIALLLWLLAPSDIVRYFVFFAFGVPFPLITLLVPLAKKNKQTNKQTNTRDIMRQTSEARDRTRRIRTWRKEANDSTLTRQNQTEEKQGTQKVYTHLQIGLCNSCHWLHNQEELCAKKRERMICLRWGSETIYSPIAH